MAPRLMNAGCEEQVVRNERGDECGVSPLTLLITSVNESRRGQFVLCVFTSFQSSYVNTSAISLGGKSSKTLQL
jgi:hypothetical protein